MTAPTRQSLAGWVAGALVLAFAAVCVAFVWQPSLASFADDSVSYLVMAQVFSPWQSASPPVAEAFVREAFYPPLYPVVLALGGAAHNIALAHAITALILATCLAVLYLLSVRWLGNKWAAVAVVVVTVLLPSPWIHVKGILSEPLFCLLLLVALFVMAGERDRWWRLGALSIVMSAMVLTRTVGLVVVAAYALWALMQRQENLTARTRALMPPIVAALSYAAWVLIRPAETADDYMRIVFERGQAILTAANPWMALGHSLLRQANSLAEAWVGALLLFWVEGRPLRIVLAGAVGALALAGMALRFAAGKPDAWMIAAYLGMFLLWPFYDQMTRFLFPVLPVLILYAFFAGARTLRALGRPSALAHGLASLLLISLAVPALGFIYQRAQTDERYGEITDWYRTPDLDQARERARIHLDLMEDMQVIRSLTEPEDRVMWVAPSYIALLANRRAIPAPSSDLSPAQYRQAVIDADPDYVFLSAYHPRDTVRDIAWRVGMEAMARHADVVHARKHGDDGTFNSVLLKMKRSDGGLLRTLESRGSVYGAN